MIDDISFAKGFRSNPRLKRVNEKFQWTEEQIAEYIKCSQNPKYFIETYVKIITIDYGLTSFKLRDYQEEILDSLHLKTKTLLCAHRQSGKSLSVCSYILWYILFNRDKGVAILANKGDVAREILLKVRTAYINLPLWLQQGVEEWNKGSIVLENGSRVIACATSTDTIRGFQCTFLMCDEVSFIDNFDEFFASVFPTISSGKNTKIALVSTPRGLNHFYKLWKNAINGLNDYNPIMVDYKRAGKSEEWATEMLRGLNGDTVRFQQEFGCAWLGSSHTLIAGWKLSELVWSTPIHQDEAGLKQYVEPESCHSYVITCDVSRGKGLDYSACSIVDVTTAPFKQVCVFRSNEITPMDYASIIFNLHILYNKATILVELNDLGEQVATALTMDFECEYVIHTRKVGHVREISFGGDNKTSPGLTTSEVTKKTGCSLLKLLIEQNQLIINDEDTIMELMTFSQKNKSWAAEKSKHDDTISALILFAWLTDQDYFKQFTDINALAKMRDRSEEESVRELQSFGILKDDHNEALPMTPEQREYERELVENERQKRRDAYEEAQSIADANQARVEEIMGKGYVINF